MSPPIVPIFLDGGGEMGERLRAHDWTTSPLGSPEGWPASLQTIVGVLLAANQPMFVAWGPERAMLYNDPYGQILGDKHPSALGRPFFEVWQELTEDVGPIMDRAFAGEPTAMDDIELMLRRHGREEKAHFSFFYAPLRDDQGMIGGMYCACTETTERVFAERRNSLLLDLGERLADLNEAADVMAEAARLLAAYIRPARVGFADLSCDGTSARNLGEWTATGVRETAGAHVIAQFGNGFAADLAAGRTIAVTNVASDPRTMEGTAAFAALGIASLLVTPVVRGGRTVAALYVHAAAPRTWATGDVALAEAAASRAWVAVERVRAERALRESEARLASMFEQAPTFMALLNGPGHRFVHANPGYMRLVGERPVLGLTVAEVLPEVANQGYIALLDRVYRTGEPYAAEGARFLLQATPEVPADERFVDFVYQPIRDAEGAITGVFVEGADVTERVRATAALRESEILGRQILDGATDYAIISTDPEGRVTRWNEGARRILGWEEAEMQGATLHRLFTPEDIAQGRVEAERRDALATGRVASDLVQLRSSGERFPASCALTTLRDDAGDPVGFVKVLRDRTEERRREGRLALLARASAGLLEASDPDAVLEPLLKEGAALLGYDQAYVYSVLPGSCPGGMAQLALTHAHGVSDRARLSLACVPFDVPLCGIVAETGRPLVLSDLLTTTEPRYAIGRAAGLDAYAGYPIFAEGRVVAVIAFAVRARPAFTAEELDVFATIARFLSVVRERLGREATLERSIAQRTAELREREAQLQQAQKMEAIGQLTGGLAHDVNNMLQGIGGALEMLERRVASGRTADLSALFRAAREGVERTAALTHGLLAFARRGQLDARPLVVDEVVEGMADLVRRTVGPSIEVRLELGDGSWATLLDRSGLESALLNLAINARDAMPDGGRLTFSTEEVALAPADLVDDADGVAAGDFVQVSVSDTGEGMPPDVLARAFEPFFTTKPIGRGTGLGLSQLYGFVRQSGGVVRIGSAPGRGTTVRLLFPRAAATQEVEAPVRREKPSSDDGGRTILLVEDEEAVRMLTAEALRERGYAVVEAADGPSGLTALAGMREVDLLVTDVGLPGLNGRQLADAARERRPTLPVLFITGYAGVALDGGLPAGMEAMAKPFSLDELIARVRGMTASAPTSCGTMALGSG